MIVTVSPAAAFIGELIPDSKLREFGKPKETIERSPGHHEEFLMACRGEKPREFSQSNFSYAGPMTANIQLGNLGAAQTDINLVRSASGGLEPVTLTAGNAIDQLLYERQFSLWWENAHRWKDARRYNRLGDLPVDKAGHGVAAFYPIPQEETTARQ